jgi:valyl-tRNA synthetase
VAAAARGASGTAQDGEEALEILPATYNATWNNWLTDVHEWCISRQLWWGHRIPAWLVSIDGKELDTVDANSWVVAHNEAEAMTKAVERFSQHDAASITLAQDPDVLDTWFSSGLFPFSVMGWPNQTPDLAKFFPGHLLETGKDILFFWVARMVMMSLALTDKLPFDTVYLHSMVRDRLGRKMSKSLGNVIDPIDVIEGAPLDKLQAQLNNGNLDPKELKKALANQVVEFPDGIAQCGADGLRFGLLSYTVQGRDINLDINLVVTKREFCNKLWNVTKFTLQNFPEGYQRPANKAVLDRIASEGTFRDRWMLSRLAQAVATMNEQFGNWTFGDACQTIQTFWVGELCDYYVEMIKPVMRGEDQQLKDDSLAVLFTCMDFGLRMLHPIMPFVTEELFHRLPQWTPEIGSIMVAKYPNAEDVSGWLNADLHAQMEDLQIIRKMANATRASLGLTRTRVDLYVMCADAKTLASVNEMIDDIALLTSSASATGLSSDAKRPVGCISDVLSPTLEVFFPVAGLPELAAEIVKREKKATQMSNSVNKLRTKVTSAGFLAKSSEEIKAEMTAKLAQQELELKSMNESITYFLDMLTVEQRADYLQTKIASVETAIKKSVGQLAKIEKNIKKNPKNKKNITQQQAQQAILAGLQSQVEDLRTQLANAQ